VQDKRDDVQTWINASVQKGPEPSALDVLGAEMGAQSSEDLMLDALPHPRLCQRQWGRMGPVDR
jgi:hypothetical protein